MALSVCVCVCVDACIHTSNKKVNIKLHEFLINHKDKKIRSLIPKLYLPESDNIVDSESEDDFEN